MSRGRRVLFFTVVSGETLDRARLLALSLREFGGRFSEEPFLVFVPEGLDTRAAFRGVEGVDAAKLSSDERVGPYPFKTKVLACGQAEQKAHKDVGSLVWLSANCLVLGPPELFQLDQERDAAFRPVHVRNIGSLGTKPMDSYWQALYDALGLSDTDLRVESMIGGEQLRPYYNTHCFSVDPRLGLMQRWQETFFRMVMDKRFQSGLCSDELHRIFLHQAVLSALVTRTVEPGRILTLPPEYSYPLHFHEELPADFRAGPLDRVVVPVYEDRTDLSILRAGGPLGSWLQKSGEAKG
ncbi:MAG: hypothetical protein JSU73_09380 [candidate division WOR-3 bacterium]|nr:MAG: hypothetical protein JSU73_09380 [candidate division WOR-3 bacterium]